MIMCSLSALWSTIKSCADSSYMHTVWWTIMSICWSRTQTFPWMKSWRKSRSNLSDGIIGNPLYPSEPTPCRAGKGARRISVEQLWSVRGYRWFVYRCGSCIGIVQQLPGMYGLSEYGFGWKMYGTCVFLPYVGPGGTGCNTGTDAVYIPVWFPTSGIVYKKSIFENVTSCRNL